MVSEWIWRKMGRGGVKGEVQWKLTDSHRAACECVVVVEEGNVTVVWFPMGGVRAEVVIETAKKVEQIINGGA